MTNTDGFLVARERDSIFCFDWVATKESLAGLGKARGPEGCPGFFLALPFLPPQASLLPPSTLLTPLNSHPDNFDCPHSCLIECLAVFSEVEFYNPNCGQQTQICYLELISVLAEFTNLKIKSVWRADNNGTAEVTPFHLYVIFRLQ